MTNLTKKVVSFSLVLLISCFMVFGVSAQINEGLDYAEDIATNGDLGTANSETAISTIINTVLGFLGIIALVVILLGGFKWMTSGGNDEKIKKAKGTLMAGVTGLIIVLAAYVIVGFVVDTAQNATTEGTGTSITE